RGHPSSIRTREIRSKEAFDPFHRFRLPPGRSSYRNRCSARFVNVQDGLVSRSLQRTRSDTSAEQWPRASSVFRRLTASLNQEIQTAGRGRWRDEGQSQSDSSWLQTRSPDGRTWADRLVEPAPGSVRPGGQAVRIPASQ